MDNLRELNVFTDVDIKNMKAEEVSRIIDSSQFIEDPDLIYAATPHMSALKLLLTIATQRQWMITVTDIQAAFLNACVDVAEVTHVKPPKEFYSSPENQSK
eukprot:3747381-Amphidinium_carterae.1